MKHCMYSRYQFKSHHKISWSLETGRLEYKPFQSLCQLTGSSGAESRLSNVARIWALKHPVSQLWDFAKFGGKTLYCSGNKGPELTTVVTSTSGLLAIEVCICRTLNCDSSIQWAVLHWCCPEESWQFKVQHPYILYLTREKNGTATGARTHTHTHTHTKGS